MKRQTVSVRDHERFQASMRAPESPGDAPEDFPAEVLERHPRRRKEREVSRLLTLLDALEGGDE